MWRALASCIKLFYSPTSTTLIGTTRVYIKPCPYSGVKAFGYMLLSPPYGVPFCVWRFVNPCPRSGCKMFFVFLVCSFMYEIVNIGWCSNIVTHRNYWLIVCIKNYTTSPMNNQNTPKKVRDNSRNHYPPLG